MNNRRMAGGLAKVNSYGAARRGLDDTGNEVDGLEGLQDSGVDDIVSGYLTPDVLSQLGGSVGGGLAQAAPQSPNGGSAYAELMNLLRTGSGEDVEMQAKAPRGDGAGNRVEKNPADSYREDEDVIDPWADAPQPRRF